MLLKSIETLRRNVKTHLSLMKIRWKEISLMIEKLSTFEKRQMNSESSCDWLYWLDSAHLFEMILQSTEFLSKMHVNMTYYVNKFKELWHSLSWETFIRACSNDFARYSNESLIFSSDVVYYRCLKSHCICERSNHMRWVFIFERNHTKQTVNADKVLLQIQSLIRKSKLQKKWRNSFINQTIRDNELICLEDVFHYISLKNVVTQKSMIFIDYCFNDRERSEISFMNDRYIIRCIFNIRKLMLRSINLLSSIREELELTTFEHQYLIKSFQRDKCILLSLLCFIDAFELYCNMYRSLLEVYMIFASLTIIKKARRSNVFSLILSLHESDFDDVMKSLQSDLSALDQDVKMMINEKKKLICAFVMIFINDMSQQHQNSDFKQFNAIWDCRYCIILLKKWEQLDIDIIFLRKYHHQTLQIRANADSQRFKIREDEIWKQ